MQRTVVEDEHAYAIRIDDGAMLDAGEQIAHAREHGRGARGGAVLASRKAGLVGGCQ